MLFPALAFHQKNCWSTLTDIPDCLLVILITRPVVLLNIRDIAYGDEKVWCTGEMLEMGTKHNDTQHNYHRYNYVSWANYNNISSTVDQELIVYSKVVLTILSVLV